MRRKPDYWRLICVMFCAAVLCGLFFHSSDVLAADGGVMPVMEQPDETTHYYGDLFCPYNYDGLTGRVVSCIQAIIVQAAKDFLASFLPFYEAIVISLLVLAVTIYGGMIALGTVRRPTGETFILLLKLAAVGFFTLEFAGSVDWIFNIMQGLLDIVTNYVTVSQLSACSDDGHLTNFFELRREVPTVWDKVDCLFITLLGIGVAQTTSFGLIMILSPLVFTGGIGLIIVVIAFFFMLTLLVAVLRAIRIYLSSVIAVAFLICVSPLIIPMLLFSHTRPLFDKWLKNLANYMLIPVFLFAYLSMIVAAYDAILFKGPSSLYYAIASEASQEEEFNFKDWVEVGASGKVERYPAGHELAGQVIYSGKDPSLLSGELVGKDVPGMYALSLMQYRELCSMCESGGCTEQERRQIELSADICDKKDDFDEMITCAINPKIPGPGSSGELGENEVCLNDGLNYYGFLSNEEIMHFALAPNIESDAERRKKAKEKEEEGCGWNPVCHAGKGLSKAAGFALDVVKNVVGAVARVTGVILQGIGNIVKSIGQLVGGACRITPVPGAICDAAGGAFMVSGSVIHASGTFVNFGGRVLMNGLLAELGDLFQGWFDVETLDIHKVASYRCKVDKNITDPEDDRYMRNPEGGAYADSCPGPNDIIIDILYVMITAAVVAYLMLKYLTFIPTLGKQIIGAARVEATLPGEQTVQKGMGKVQHGLEAMLEKRKLKGKRR